MTNGRLNKTRLIPFSHSGNIIELFGYKEPRQRRTLSNLQLFLFDAVDYSRRCLTDPCLCFIRLVLGAGQDRFSNGRLKNPLGATGTSEYTQLHVPTR